MGRIRSCPQDVVREAGLGSRQEEEAIAVRLTLHLLGPPEVRLEGEPVADFVSDKARALLFYPTVEAERAYRREALAGLLWPDYPERSARTDLSNTLSNLRAVIGDREVTPSYPLVSRETIQLNATSDHWLDVAAFEALVDERRWEEAVALHRGGFLEGFSLPDSAPFEGWAADARLAADGRAPAKPAVPQARGQQCTLSWLAERDH